MSVAAQYVTNSVDAALWHAKQGGGFTLALTTNRSISNETIQTIAS